MAFAVSRVMASLTVASRVGVRGLALAAARPVIAASRVRSPVVAAIGRRSLFIQIEATPNPDSLKFVPEGKRVLQEGQGTGVHFGDVASARGSKLARTLLKLPAIKSVFFGPDFISVNKAEEASWETLRPHVLDAIMNGFAGGEPVVQEVLQSADTLVTEEDDETTAMIKELLESRIRPAVQEDGGDIFFAGFDHDTGVVRLRMAGSCVGCPSSTATLRNGVENMIKHYIPEVTGIEQVTEDADTGAVEVVAAPKPAVSLDERLAAAGVPR